MRTLRASFNIFISDDFEEQVKEYFGESETPIEEIQMEEMRQYLEDNMMLAHSRVDTFEIEGGDTDGWFIQNVEMEQ